MASPYMFITFTRAYDDLLPTSDFWSSDTFEHRKQVIFDVIFESTSDEPSENMMFIRKGSFHITDEVTMPMLIMLSEHIRETFMIDCFQISIDRKRNMANMLFDWNNRSTKQSYVLNHQKQIALSVMIIRDLHLPRPEECRFWKRYFLLSEYNDDNQVFQKVLDDLHHVKLGKKTLAICEDMTEYMEQFCQGLVK